MIQLLQINSLFLRVLNFAIQPFSLKLREHKIANVEFVSQFHVENMCLKYKSEILKFVICASHDFTPIFYSSRLIRNLQYSLQQLYFRDLQEIIWFATTNIHYQAISTPSQDMNQDLFMAENIFDDEALANLAKIALEQKLVNSIERRHMYSQNFIRIYFIVSKRHLF